MLSRALRQWRPRSASQCCGVYSDTHGPDYPDPRSGTDQSCTVTFFAISNRVILTHSRLFCTTKYSCYNLAAPGDRSTLYDLLIIGGRVIDGTGSPWYWADVAVQAGHIVEIGK